VANNNRALGKVIDEDLREQHGRESAELSTEGEKSSAVGEKGGSPSGFIERGGKRERRRGERDRHRRLHYSD
jgi:hypothetical protein